MDYSSAIKYLDSFVNYEKKITYPYKQSLKLERIKDFLVILGNPQNYFKSIHIAGTKGKGSVCAFTAYILREAGFSVGLYTSPHLSSVRERIRILRKKYQGVRVSKCQEKDAFEGMIPREALVRLVQKLKPKIDAYNKKSPFGPLTFFEVYTALAFNYFKERKVDFAVLETGLGGRLDATNVVNAIVSGITPISFDHMDKLGNTLREIAAEKAGIVKKCQSVKVSECQSVVVSAAQAKVARQVIRARCKKMGALLFEVGRVPVFKKTKTGFFVRGIKNTYRDLRIRLLGGHQIANATMAVGIIEALQPYGIEVSADQIKKGLYLTRWPGRCEIVGRNPFVILDGAQNVASVKALQQSVEELVKYKRLILVLGISQDKDISGICRQLKSCTDLVVVTKADNPRAAAPESLIHFFNGKEAYIAQSVKKARKKALFLAGSRDLILVCGSLFLVAEFRDLCVKI